jgi:osmotically-inducible protein OsmY
VVLAIALRSNPLTASYPIATTWRDGAVVLTGRVGTTQIHDEAIRVAIASGLPFRDQLVIDTAAAHEVAQSAALSAAGLSRGAAGPTLPPYFYPPPLMGRLDDPFFGFVPPIVSFPPWWPRRNDPASFVQPRKVSAGSLPGSGPLPGAPTRKSDAPTQPQPGDTAPVLGDIEISVDDLGQVLITGVVADEEAGRRIAEAARSVPGVTRVTTEFQLQPRRANNDAPPPPPRPMLGPTNLDPGRTTPKPGPRQVPNTPAGPAALDASDLTERVVAALKRRPIAAGLPLGVRSADNFVTVSGQVPSAYEAMIVYRTVQQTPGVREIIDRLDFDVPDDDHPNPLLRKGRPDDLEPYLAAQIRRHLGDLAHLDRVHARGDMLELYGTLSRSDDQDRLLAILRSIPLLQGFRLKPTFSTDQ